MLALLACASACAARSGFRDGRFVYAELGGELGDLAALEPGWSRESNADAALAYRHADGSRASWVRDCRSVSAPARALARALWIALPGAELDEEGGLEVAGAPGWRRAGRAHVAGQETRVESVTRVSKRCEDSWLLVVPHREPHHQDAFARWWGEFRDREPTR